MTSQKLAAASAVVTGSPSIVTRLVVVAIAALLCLPVLGVSPASAAVDVDAETTFLGLVNVARAEAGAAPVVVAADLVEVARRHSAIMASEVHLHHNPTLGDDVADWRKVGENVGRGPRVLPIHDAFMASQGHRTNILDADWTEIGIGVEVRDGRVWVTQIFREPLAAVSQDRPVVAPVPAPASAAPSTGSTTRIAPSTAPAPTPQRSVAAPPAPRLPPRFAPRPVGPDFGHTAGILARVAASLGSH